MTKGKTSYTGNSHHTKARVASDGAAKPNVSSENNKFNKGNKLNSFKEPSNKIHAKDTTGIRVANFAWIGIALTIIDYAIYELLIICVFGNNVEMTSIASAISALITTFVAYFLHSHITWRTRNPGRWGIVKFFLWNFLLALAIRPFLAWTMGLLTFIYDFVYMVSQWLSLPFTHEYITTTGIFGFMSVITMIINYFVYDALIFGQAKTSEDN